MQDKRQPNLDDYASRQNASDRSSGLLGSLKAFIAETASNIPTGFSLLLLAEQESAVTAEYGKLEECLLQALMEDKDLAAAFLQLFIRGFKRYISVISSNLLVAFPEHAHQQVSFAESEWQLLHGFLFLPMVGRDALLPAR